MGAMRAVTRRAVDGLAALGGALLAALFGLILVFRRPRPIHARGVVLEGELRWMPTRVRTGLAWVDEAAGESVPVTARLSRSAGLPSWSPDVIGLAIRIADRTGSGDLETASTGWGVPGRFLLRPRRHPGPGAFTTIMPYRTSEGPRLVGLRSVTTGLPADLGDFADALGTRRWQLQLSVAAPRGPWLPCALLTLRARGDEDDTSLRFDAVAHPLPRTASYRWTRLARRPAYRLAQRAGGDETSA